MKDDRDIRRRDYQINHQVNHRTNRQVNRRTNHQINRRKQVKKRIFFLVRMAVLLVLLLCIINQNVRLKELQTKWKSLEIQNALMSRSDGGAQETVYVDGSDVLRVEKPVERTQKEVLKRLEEMGQANSVIEGICQNADQYPEEMLAALANNPEMADFVAGYPGEKKGSAGGLTAAEKEEEFPLFLQWDSRWGYQSYGTKNCIGMAGCGPTCMSMVLYYLTGDESLTPDTVAEYSMQNGYYVEGSGTLWVLFEDMPKLYDIQVTNLSLSENNMKAVLNDGGIIACVMGRGDFTLSGHFIVIYGYDSEGFMVNDPNCIARSDRRWTYSELEKQIRNIWAYEKS